MGRDIGDVPVAALRRAFVTIGIGFIKASLELWYSDSDEAVEAKYDVAAKRIEQIEKWHNDDEVFG